MRSALGKRAVLFLFVLLATTIVASLAFSETDAERGKDHFTNPEFAGGSRACNDCHINGRGLEGTAKKTKFMNEKSGMKAFAATINYCIANANGGKKIQADSKEMLEIIEYIKSLSQEDIGVRG